ncbi:12307_t:CDS:2 [Acaulospora morrowiae]|uniref:12307_t:CDS:1 n=1 Tax=Acaulospora morrowiae TaxID=94023 RepID=A0A9N8YRL6_9GLOM|nr:12307_t:CDS:2 [Acaulospora morrowiae]
MSSWRKVLTRYHVYGLDSNLKTKRLPLHCLYPRALQRTFGSTHVFSQEWQEDELHKGYRYTQVPSRGLIEVIGEDSVKFLQGLITNHMPRISSGGEGFYAAFLNPVGRVLYDTFIYPKNLGDAFPHPNFLVECDSRILKDLAKHMEKYLLRSKVSIVDASTKYRIWNLWGSNISNLWWQHQIPNKTAIKLPAGSLILKESISDIGCRDSRCPYMGLRLVLPFDKSPSVPASFSELPSEEYVTRRIFHGVPEGIDDFEPGTSLPLQSNFDYMGGTNGIFIVDEKVDWRKGCYIGQELTFRTYYIGVTRKRIVPVQLYRDDQELPTQLKVDRKTTIKLPPPSSGIYTSIENLSKQGRPVGNIGSAQYNIALALITLDKVQENDLFVANGRGDVYRVKPFIPDWWPKVNDKGG